MRHFGESDGREIEESFQRFYERDWPLMLEDPIAPEDGAITCTGRL